MAGLVKAYLVCYNAACMAGWAWALVLAVQSLISSGGDLTTVWTAAGLPLQVAQWAMLLEVVHAMTGLVRSPVFTVVLSGPLPSSELFLRVQVGNLLVVTDLIFLRM